MIFMLQLRLQVLYGIGMERVDNLVLCLILVELLWASLHLSWCWLAVNPLHYVNLCPLYALFLLYFHHECVGIYQNLSCIYEMNILFLTFDLLCAGYVCWFTYVEPCGSGMKSTGSVDGLSDVFLNSVFEYFIENFCIMFISKGYTFHFCWVSVLVLGLCKKNLEEFPQFRFWEMIWRLLTLVNLWNSSRILYWVY